MSCLIHICLISIRHLQIFDWMCNICCLFQCIVHFQRRCCCVSRDCCQCTPHAPSPFNDALAKVSALSPLLPGFVYLLQSFGELIRGNLTENISLSLSVSNHHLIVYLWCTQGSFQNIIGKTYQTLGVFISLPYFFFSPWFARFWLQCTRPLYIRIVKDILNFFGCFFLKCFLLEECKMLYTNHWTRVSRIQVN